MLSRETAAALAAHAGTPSIDLPAQQLRAGDAVHDFAIDPEAKAILIGGLDAIDLTLQSANIIAAWQARDRNDRPWACLQPI